MLQINFKIGKYMFYELYIFIFLANTLKKISMLFTIPI